MTGNIEVKASNRIPYKLGYKYIFLAGTIDQGNSEDWQKKVQELLKEKDQIVFLNPRRDDWDNSWDTQIENSQFYQQVNWELNGLDRSDFIIMNLLPDSKSPISLLELGLYARSKKIIVICPDNFYRSGNVQIVCDRFNIPLVKTVEDAVNLIDILI